jgi:nitrile hydratase
MNGVHDMGGMHGFGPIVREADEPLFHAPWEGRVRAMVVLSRERGYFNIDAFRYGIERMEPAHYLRASYFERWLATLEHNLVQEGLLTADELEARMELLRQHPDATFTPPATTDRASRGPAERIEAAAASPAPRFAVGDAVLTRNVHPAGHTRLPRYARGKRGVIARAYGAQTLPDTNAHGLGEQPEPLYKVRFAARELWGEAAEPDGAVSIDLWESYLGRG